MADQLGGTHGVGTEQLAYTAATWFDKRSGGPRIRPTVSASRCQVC